MKKLLALLFLLPLVAFAGEEFGKRYYASINIHSKTHADIEVFVDGIRYDLRGNLNIYDLQPGSHDIKVVEHCINNRGYGFAKVIYRDRVFLPHGAELFACVDNRGRFQITEIVKPRARQNNYCTTSCNMRHQHFYNRGHKHRQPARPARRVVCRR